MNKLQLKDFDLAFERRGQGTPLVLLHGYPLDHSIWEPLVPMLEKDFDLILPDLPGFGESGQTTGSFGMADYAAVIAALLDSLGVWQTAIAGHSMGGYIALSFVRLYPQRTLGLGLVASQVLADPPEKKAARYQEAEDILVHGVQSTAEGMSAKLTTDPALQAKIKALILQQKPQGLAVALRAMADRPDSTGLLPGAVFPIVLIHGIADVLVPIDRARSLKMTLPSAHLTEIPKAGHMPMLEAQEATAEALKKLR
jgi:3-oxoadipate enol-lactonase